MTMNTASDAPSTDQGRARLEEYQPTGLPASTWDLVRRDAIELVMSARPDSAERARKDLELLADVVRHLGGVRVEITLDNILADTTLASYDTALRAAGAAGGTLENKRGRFRRLQAAHRGVPWRKARRADGERLAAQVQPEILHNLADLMPGEVAEASHGAGALRAAWEDARRRRRGLEGSLAPSVWGTARAFAQSQGRPTTRRELDAAATYEVLEERQPAARLMQTYGLTRRDLDLALVLAGRLPEEPEAEHRDLLRG